MAFLGVGESKQEAGFHLVTMLIMRMQPSMDVCLRFYLYNYLKFQVAGNFRGQLHRDTPHPFLDRLGRFRPPLRASRTYHRSSMHRCTLNFDNFLTATQHGTKENCLPSTILHSQRQILTRKLTQKNQVKILRADHCILLILSKESVHDVKKWIFFLAHPYWPSLSRFLWQLIVHSSNWHRHEDNAPTLLLRYQWRSK